MDLEETIQLASMIATQIASRLEMNFQVMPTLTLSQATKALWVSEEKVRQLCNEGQIPYIRLLWYGAGRTKSAKA